jgi:flagellar basal body-associated protein FliL
VATILGFIGLVVFIVCVIALAAAITWVVVKVSPSKKPKEKAAPAEPEES